MNRLLLYIIFSCFICDSFCQSLEWGHSLTGTTGSIEGGGNFIKRDGLANIYLIGDFENTMDFDPGPSVFNMTSHGGKDFFITKSDSLGNFLWGKSIGGPNHDYIASAGIDSSGNVVGTGHFSGTIDFDPGPGVVNKTHSGGPDQFCIKLDPAGNLVFINTLSSTGNETGEQLCIDSQGNIILTGMYGTIADFDPGPGTFSLNAAIDGSIYISKYNSSGNFIWAKTLQTSTAILYSSYTDHADNIYLNGVFNDTIDLDPGTGISTLTAVNTSFSDSYILKLDSNADFIWAKPIYCTSSVGRYFMSFDDDLNIYLSFDFKDTLNPATGITRISKGDWDVFVGKLNSSGNLIWHRSFGNNTIDQVQSIFVDSTKTINLTAYSINTVDVNPSEYTYNLTSVGAYNSYILKLTENSDFIWAKQLPSPGMSQLHYLSVDNDFNILATGSLATSVDIDPSIGIYNLTGDIFYFVWSQDSCSIMPFGISLDSLQDVTCQTGTGFVNAVTYGGYGPYSFSWDASPSVPDSFFVFPGIGTHTLLVTDIAGCQRDLAFHINGPTLLSGFELSINAVFPNFFPGDTNMIALISRNEACDTVSGEMIFVLDSAIHFISASIAPDMISGDTLKWFFTGKNYDSAAFESILTVITSTYVTLGDSLTFFASVLPESGDLDIANNTKYYYEEVVSSFDPNDKQVYPQGIDTNHNILNNLAMTYTVRFQNTGTAPAKNIFIVDTLDTNLDLATLNVIAASHIMHTEVLGSNVLKFVFNDINLPDSTTDEPNSHGYVVYEIDQLPDLPDNTMIENTAYIYFDYNEPVMTNTVFNTIDLGSSFTVTNNNFCAGNSTLLTAVPNVPGLIANWNWYTGGCGGTFVGAGQNLIVTPTTSQIYYLFDSVNGTCVDTLITVISVNTNLTQSGATLTANATPATYQWLACDAVFSPISGETNQSFTATADGNYAVIVTEGGCADTSACYLVTGVGLENRFDENGIKVYPNPANEYLTVEGCKPGSIIKLHDIGGKTLIQTTTLSNKQILYGLIDLSKGIYMLEVNNTERRQYFKVIKE